MLYLCVRPPFQPSDQLTNFNKPLYKYLVIPEHRNIIISNIIFTSNNNTADARNYEVGAISVTLTLGPWIHVR